LNNPIKVDNCRDLLSIFIIPIILFFFTLKCEASEDQQPPKVGNFTLPNSQQPGPLVGFGENTLEKNEAQLFLFADDFAGVNKYFIDVVPGILYGITDDLSIFVNIPYAASYNIGSYKSTGFEDAFVQLEYEFYDKSTSSSVDQATVVANVTIPTGSNQKNPSTGVGSPSFFLGTTFNRTYINWFIFGSPGAVFTTAKNGTKFGNSYLYQFGFGRNMADINGWLFAWMAEIDGTYSQRNRVQGIIDPNSGGNVVYVTPSLWASTKKFIFQFGAGWPVTQHLYGNQTRDAYLLVANVGWSIY
jgi:hypothetical protein